MTDQTAAERARQRHLEAEARRVQEEAARKVVEMRRAMEESMKTLLGG